MSSTTFAASPNGPSGRMPRTDEEILREMERVLGRVPKDGLIDPRNVARQVGVDALAALGYLHMLIARGVGGFVVRVVTPDGVELRRFNALREVKATVEDEFGQVHEVSPESVEIAFDPHARRQVPRRLPWFLRPLMGWRR